MRKITSLLFIIVMLASSLSISAQKKKVASKIYAYGMSASFNDSLIYFTDIQEIDSVWIETKTKFLVNREVYSNQFRDFLAQQKHEPNRTCIFTYALERKDIEKKYLKTKTRYTRMGDFDVRYLTTSDFQFHPVKLSADDTEETEMEPEKKKNKKNKKSKKK